MLSKERPVRVEIFLTEKESEKLIAQAKKEKRSRKNLIEGIVINFLNNSRQKASATVKFVFLICFFFSCNKQTEITPISNAKIDPIISKVKDFEIELPHGNEFYADSIDVVKIKIHGFDYQGQPIQIRPKLSAIKMYIDGKIINTVDYNTTVLFKTKDVKTYKLTVDVNGIIKDVVLKSVPKTFLNAKLIEFPILFRFVNLNYSDEYINNTIDILNEVFLIKNNTNFKFKLAKYDSFGNRLERNGIILIKDEKLIIDMNTRFNSYDYGGNIPNNIDIYVTNSKDYSMSGFYDPSNRNIVVNTYNLSNYSNRFGVVTHEMGHYFDLEHVNRKDNNCNVQLGINDIEAYNRSNGTQSEYLSKGQYLSNCGNIKMIGNLMDQGEQLISKDQVKIMRLSDNTKH